MHGIKYKQFTLKQAYFENRSALHGINHTYRVMYHVQQIGLAAGLKHEILWAWCAAFIHDMARQHDGYCTEHGYWSAKTKLPLFEKLFIEEGVSPEGLEAIKLAVTNHSQAKEIAIDHPYYKTVALLKDADALDRVRISEHNLKIEMLRFPESKAMVEFAKKLFRRTDSLKLKNFAVLLKIAEEIRVADIQTS